MRSGLRSFPVAVVQRVPALAAACSQVAFSAWAALAALALWATPAAARPAPAGADAHRAPAASQAAPAHRSSPPVHGFIVKLRASASRARALSAAGRDGGSTGEADETSRLRSLLADSGIRGAAGRPVGLAARLVELAAPLDAAQAEAAAARLRALPDVEWVVPNDREHRLTTPSDPLFAASAQTSGQWWLRLAAGSAANAVADRTRGVPGLQAAWSLQTGSAAAVVAVLDTGITRHLDLNAHVLAGHDFVSSVEFANDGDGRDTDPSDPGDWVSQSDKDGNPALFGSCDVEHSSWHGTIVASIVAGVTDNSFGVAGINWDGRVVPVRVAGKCGAEVADIIDGMRWAAGLPVAGAPTNANPARIVNISFGGSAPCNAAYQEAIDELRARGTVVVAAAGNDRAGVKRPASCAGVIGVAALNRDGFKSSYSSFGPQVAVSTVGGDPTSEGAWGALLGDDALLTIDNLGLRQPEAPTFGRQAGTSFATPVVAGVLSLMLSSNSSLSAAQLIDGIRRSARPHVVSQLMGACSADNPGRCACTTDTCGAGIVDAPQALAFAADPAGYVAPARAGESVDSAELQQAVALGADQPPNAMEQIAADSGGGGRLGGAALAGLLLAVIALRASRHAIRGRPGR